MYTCLYIGHVVSALRGFFRSITLGAHLEQSLQVEEYYMYIYTSLAKACISVKGRHRKSHPLAT